MDFIGIGPGSKLGYEGIGYTAEPEPQISEQLITEGGDRLVTEAGDPLVTEGE